ncbi:hypothetical protein HYQ45_000545 [Verticillium longisporum]|uniref:Uncharacterized protein n=2 Tax=Verticillium TaxID=1036719 RepID=A0A8I3A491_VERLO|nr:hypothetical protein VdG1_04318 [Verticillium dahliae VDG1]KAG7143294.1 hypothetical protein HYQ45_000545 [Verticillium longisporum]RBQ71078.1 hypothetical protein VDGD_08002 [Verticillium dahliae]RXG48845.1 hypothetical protein VDGE_08002 [Verticillium dahliae]
MGTNDTQPLGDVPPGAPQHTCYPSQSWTRDGHPIVDGKYHDLTANEIKTHTGLVHGGPPSTSVYWQNRAPVRRPDQLVAMGAVSRHKATEYLVRVGEMLRAGMCTVTSLNATEFAVNVIVLTEASVEEFSALLRESGLLP